MEVVFPAFLCVGLVHLVDFHMFLVYFIPPLPQPSVRLVFCLCQAGNREAVQAWPHKNNDTCAGTPNRCTDVKNWKHNIRSTRAVDREFVSIYWAQLSPNFAQLASNRIQIGSQLDPTGPSGARSEVGQLGVKIVKTWLCRSW